MSKLKTPLLFVSALMLAAPAFAQTATTPATPAAPAAPAATTPAAPAAPAAGTTTVITNNAYVAPEGYSLLSDWATVTADDLKGTDIHGPDDSKIGNITDVEIGTDGKVTGLIADIGGFLGMGAHTVNLGLDQVSLYANADKKIIAHSSMTKDALKSLPAYEAKK